MEESSTYQAIKRRGVEEGRVEGIEQGIREMLLAIGRDRFGGDPPSAVQSHLDAVTDRSRLLELGQRVLHVESWDELIAAPPKRPRKKKS